MKLEITILLLLVVLALTLGWYWAKSQDEHEQRKEAAIGKELILGTDTLKVVDVKFWGKKAVLENGKEVSWDYFIINKR